MAVKGSTYTELQPCDRKAILGMLFMLCNEDEKGELPKGSFVRVSKETKRCAKQVSRVWRSIRNKMTRWLVAEGNLEQLELLKANRLPL